MKIPKICRIHAPLDRQGAGWHVPHSVVLKDIVPQFRYAGGGVCREGLSALPASIDMAIKYTKQHIAEAEAHLRKLEKAKAEIDA